MHVREAVSSSAEPPVGLEREHAPSASELEVRRLGEERFRVLADSAPVLIWLCDTQNLGTWYNRPWLEFRGRTLEQELGVGWLEGIHPEDREHCSQTCGSAFEARRPFTMEFRFRRHDGQYRWVYDSGVPLYGPEGRFEGYIGSMMDITDHKLASERVRASEERLRLGLEAGRTGTWDWDIVSNRVVWSEQIYEFHGLRPGEFGGAVEDFARLVHPEDAPLMDQAIRAALAEGRPFEMEFRTVRADGEVRWLSTTGRVLRDASGAPVRMLGATIDVTERRRTEQALRDSEDRFRVALKNTPISVYTNDTDLRYTWVYNPRWGYSPEAIVGKRDGELLPIESIRELVELKKQVLATGAGQRRQIATTIEGRDYVFDVTVEPFRDKAGRMSGVTVASMDITEVVKSRREAEMASRAKDQFLAVLSHELRTPLTPVLLTTSMLQTRQDLPEDVRAELASIRRNIELESRLISDLLDLTHISRGNLRLEIEEVDLHLVIRSAIDICQREASARLVCDLAAQRHVVRGDATRLQQVFWNLISNAQKFTPADGRITVRSSDAADGRVRVEVTDTGAGIEPDVLPRLFDAFEQGKVRSERLQAGLGLGLAISRRLVESHGGRISAHSQGHGRGATFVVELPALAEGVTAPACQDPAAAPAVRQTLGVLLVEDHEPTLRALSRLLRQLGHRVRAVDSAAGAKAAARQERFDLIISDLGLPDGSGLDVLRELRQEYAGRAIALTGYGMDSDVQASRDAGFAEHLTKPVDFQTLQAAIVRTLQPDERSA